jgi:hypothetical protein
MKVEVKKFTTNCNTNSGGVSPVTLYIGYPAKDSHPLAFQSRWLSDRGISIPQNIMESFSKLMEISISNNLPFIDLVEYVIKEVELGKSLQNDAKKASEISADTKPELKESTTKVLVDNSNLSQENQDLKLSQELEKSQENQDSKKINIDDDKEVDNLIKSQDSNLTQKIANLDSSSIESSPVKSLQNEAEIQENQSPININSNINANSNSISELPKNLTQDLSNFKSDEITQNDNQNSKSLFNKISKK